MTKIIRILIALAFCLIAVSAIFFFSEQKGSTSHMESGRFAAKLSEMITSSSDTKFSATDRIILTKALDFPIRKCAHLFIYFCLGFILYLSAVFIQKDKRNPVFILICLLLVIAVASADEINQMFKEGRGSSALDVLIDTIGGAAGIYFYYIITDFIGHVRSLFDRSEKNAGSDDMSGNQAKTRNQVMARDQVVTGNQDITGNRNTGGNRELTGINDISESRDITGNPGETRSRSVTESRDVTEKMNRTEK